MQSIILQGRRVTTPRERHWQSICNNKNNKQIQKYINNKQIYNEKSIYNAISLCADCIHAISGARGSSTIAVPCSFRKSTLTKNLTEYGHPLHFFMCQAMNLIPF